MVILTEGKQKDVEGNRERPDDRQNLFASKPKEQQSNRRVNGTDKNSEQRGSTRTVNERTVNETCSTSPRRGRHFVNMNFQELHNKACILLTE